MILNHLKSSLFCDIVKFGPRAFATSGDHDGRKMEAKLAKLNTKLALLDLTRGKTDGIVDTGIVEKIRRQKEALQAIVGSTEELKREVEEAKLETGESLDKVKEWGQEIEERIDIVDNEIKVLETRVKSARRATKI